MSEEDLEIEFENQSGDKHLIYYHDSDNWCIEKDYMDYPLVYFKLLKDAEACAEILKRSM